MTYCTKTGMRDSRRNTALIFYLTVVYIFKQKLKKWEKVSEKSYFFEEKPKIIAENIRLVFPVFDLGRKYYFLFFFKKTGEQY